MSRERRSRFTSFNSLDMSYKTDSSATSLRRIGRMYTSPSLDRINSMDRPSFLSGYKSIVDLSRINETSSLGMSSPIVHRNASFQRMRADVWRKSENKKMFSTKQSFHSSRHNLHSNNNYLGMSSTTHSSTPSRYMDPISVLDRRDQFFSQLNSFSTPRRTNRALTSLRQWPHITTASDDSWRARIRERPLLAKLSHRSKTPRLSPDLNSKTSSTSSTKMNDSVRSHEDKDGSGGIYRNRHIIKFREHNLGQTPSQRRSSITWDLPKSLTSVKASDELPISEDLESETHLDNKDAESQTETKQKESVSEDLNESNNLGKNDKQIKNDENIKHLVSDEEIPTKVISNEFQPKCNASQVVIDILPIHTPVMPEPNGTTLTSPLHQRAVSLKSKTIDDQNIQKVIETKSPKKKKVKKKEPKDKTKAEPKPKEQENIVQNTVQQIKPIEENVSTKVENKVSKDINENILNERDLNQAKKLVSTPKKIRFRKYTFDDFNLIRVLGRGSFGKVFLAELKGHNIHFAIKCLKKHSVIEDDDIESIMIERKVLAYGSAHPFICKLFCTFQTESYLCFTMEWCCGGDLMFHVQKQGKFNEDKARFYASEILCAVKFMHNKGIVYRDLKLDNIMVDNKGHLRLVDFGMCQGRIYREDLLPSNFCGTPEYMAPEIIKGVKYNQSVDFWSFGVLLYEMVVGISPFHGTDEDELLWNVCNEEVRYPIYLSENVKSILVLLLNKCPEQRLGMPSCPGGDIYSQPFFRHIDWVKVEKCQMKPPFVPELSSSSDVSYFESYFTKEEPNLTPASEELTLTMDQTLFQGFSYTNHNMTD